MSQNELEAMKIENNSLTELFAITSQELLIDSQKAMIAVDFFKDSQTIMIKLESSQENASQNSQSPKRANGDDCPQQLNASSGQLQMVSSSPENSSHQIMKSKDNQNEYFTIAPCNTQPSLESSVQQKHQKFTTVKDRYTELNHTITQYPQNIYEAKKIHMLNFLSTSGNLPDNSEASFEDTGSWKKKKQATMTNFRSIKRNNHPINLSKKRIRTSSISSTNVSSPLGDSDISSVDDFDHLDHLTMCINPNFAVKPSMTMESNHRCSTTTVKRSNDSIKSSKNNFSLNSKIDVTEKPERNLTKTVMNAAVGASKPNNKLKDKRERNALAARRLREKRREEAESQDKELKFWENKVAKTRAEYNSLKEEVKKFRELITTKVKSENDN